MIFLDTETTGLSEPRLVELAFAEHGHVPIVVRVRPPKAIELEATVVHGMRNKDVAHLPLFKDHAQYAWIKTHLEGNTIVAHNAPFDVGVLANEGIFVREWIDTKTLAMKKWPDAPKHRLQHLRHWLDLPVGGDTLAHSAAGDVEVLMALWDRLNDSSAASATDLLVSTGEARPSSRTRRTSVRLPKGWKPKSV